MWFKRGEKKINYVYTKYRERGEEKSRDKYKYNKNEKRKNRRQTKNTNHSEIEKYLYSWEVRTGGRFIC